MLNTSNLLFLLLCFCLNGNMRSEVVPNVDWTLGNTEDTTLKLLCGLSEADGEATIDQLCNVFLQNGKSLQKSKPKINEFSLQLNLPCLEVSIRLKRTKRFLKNPNFDKEKKVVIFITGWLSDVSRPAIEDMAAAYHCRGGYNFLSLDMSQFLETFHDWCTMNTEVIGVYLAEGLQDLLPSISAKNIHLIGHSLGAHIAGKAGRHFKKLTGKTLNRITGLDPASVCFQKDIKKLGVQSGDADFVDIIHTNIGGAGINVSVGDVDFYPGGISATKPGCYQFGCSHIRAIEYYTETVYPRNTKNFLAQKCNSLGLSCGGPSYAMGFTAANSLTGEYFLVVGSRSPYGQNAESTPIKVGERCFKCSKG